MPVDSTHPAYDDKAPVWAMIRDVIEGARSVKARGECYLPKLYKQTTSDYAAYKERAVFFNATGRTADAYVGMIMRKPPVITTTDDLADFLEDCDLRGTPFLSYIEEIVGEQVTISRAGTLIDWNEIEGRPYITGYEAEDIINWKTERRNGKVVLTMVMLHEISTIYNPATGDNAPADDYVNGCYHQWRELILDETQGVIVKVWRRRAKESKSKADEFVLIETVAMTRRAKPLPMIPFVFHGMKADTVCVATPLIADLADMNVAHYRQSADHENGLHVAGLPTPWAAGFTDDKTTELALGTTNAWVTEKTDAKCGFLEFMGQGLEPIQAALKAKEVHMAALGSRAIEAPKADAEAYETVKLRHRAELNSLTTAAQNSSRSLSDVLQWAGWWLDTVESIEDLEDVDHVVVNDQLVEAGADATMITALLSALQMNAISFDTFFFNLQKREMYQEQRTMEEEQAAIQANPLPAPITLDANGDPTPPAPKPGEAPPPAPGKKTATEPTKKPPAKTPAK